MTLCLPSSFSTGTRCRLTRTWSVPRSASAWSASARCANDGEDEAKLQLAGAMARRQECEQQVTAAAERVADARSAQLATGLSSAVDLVARQAYLERVESAHRSTLSDLERHEQNVAGRRSELTEAARDRQALEHLKASRLADHSVRAPASTQSRSTRSQSTDFAGGQRHDRCDLAPRARERCRGRTTTGIGARGRRVRSQNGPPFTSVLDDQVARTAAAEGQQGTGRKAGPATDSGRRRAEHRSDVRERANRSPRTPVLADTAVANGALTAAAAGATTSQGGTRGNSPTAATAAASLTSAITGASLTSAGSSASPVTPGTLSTGTSATPATPGASLSQAATGSGASLPLAADIAGGQPVTGTGAGAPGASPPADGSGTSGGADTTAASAGPASAPAVPRSSLTAASGVQVPAQPTPTSGTASGSTPGAQPPAVDATTTPAAATAAPQGSTSNAPSTLPGDVTNAAASTAPGAQSGHATGASGGHAATGAGSAAGPQAGSPVSSLQSTAGSAHDGAAGDNTRHGAPAGSGAAQDGGAGSGQSSGSTGATTSTQGYASVAASAGTTTGTASTAQTSGTTSTATQLPVTLQNAVDAVKATVTMAVRQGQPQAQISLSPPSLGSIRISLQQTSEGLIARVAADHPEALRLLAQNSSELRSSLQASGLPVVRLDIGAGGQSGPGSRPSNQNSGQAGGAGAGQAAAGDESGEEEQGLSAQARVLAGAGSLVDVMA